MKFLSVIPALLLLTACSGVDSELVASGKAHQCEIASLQSQLQTSPDDTRLQSELQDRTGLLEAVVTTADQGDQADLRAAIAAAVAEGCP